MDRKTIWKIFGEAFLRSMVVLMAILILGFAVFFIVKVASDKKQMAGNASEAGSTYSDDELEKMLDKENAKDTEGENASTEEKTEEPTTEEVVDISSKDQNILVLNSTGVAGLAKRWMDKLKGDGFSEVKTGNYSVSSGTQTKIYVPKEGMGKDLAEYFTDAVIEVGSLDSGIDVSTDGVQIFIVLGSNDTNVQ